MLDLLEAVTGVTYANEYLNLHGICESESSIVKFSELLTITVHVGIRRAVGLPYLLRSLG